MLERPASPSAVEGIDRWSLRLAELAILLLDLLLLTQGVALAVGVLGCSSRHFAGFHQRRIRSVSRILQEG